MIKQSHVNAGNFLDAGNFLEAGNLFDAVNFFDFIYPGCIVPLPVKIAKGCHASLFVDYDCTIMDMGSDIN